MKDLQDTNAHNNAFIGIINKAFANKRKAVDANIDFPIYFTTEVSQV